MQSSCRWAACLFGLAAYLLLISGSRRKCSIRNGTYYPIPSLSGAQQYYRVNTLNSTSFDIVLPAGGTIDGAFSQAAGTHFKALTMWQGQTLLNNTINCLKQSGYVNRVVVIGSEAVLKEAASCGAECIPEGESGTENLFLGIQKILESKSLHQQKVLICASDLPMLTPDAINWFISNSSPDADISVPVITATSYEKAYPRSGSVYVPLKDGASTMGCLFLLNPIVIMNHRQKIEEVFNSRKNQLKTFSMLGPMFLLKYITRQLSISDIENRCEDVFGWRGRAVRDAPPELGCDIDTLEDYLYAQRLGRKLEDAPL